MSSFPESLLSAQDPPPFRVLEGNPSSPFLLTCDHAGKLLPQSLGTLGLGPVELQSHIAWDIGAAGVARHLAGVLEAFLILQTYSRLVIDCNRPLGAQSSIAEVSETTVIPGNRGISASEAERRAAAVFHPYHRRIERELERRHTTGAATFYVALHSFTPRFRGVDRPWHAGVLYGTSARFARTVLEVLRDEQQLLVGDNEPYFVSELTDYGVVQHAERRALPYVELEIRQDLIASESDQAAWAELLARVLSKAAARFC